MSEEIRSNATDSAKPDEQPVSDVPAANEVAEQQQQPEPTKEMFEALMSDAHKALVIQNLEDAIEVLDKAAEMSVDVFGDLASETFTPHFLFGKTMIELAKKEQEELANKVAVDGTDKEAIIRELKESIKEFAGSFAQNFGEALGDAVDQDEAIDGKEAAKEDNAVVAEPEKQVLEEKSEAEKQAVAEKTEAEKQAVAEKTEAEKQDESAASLQDDEEESDSEDDDEELDAMQLAFEFLEHARLVCEKHTGSDDALTWLGRLKDTLLLLAQIAIDDESYENAINDLSKALKIVEDNFSDQLRELASIRVELAHAHRKNDDAASANAQVDLAIKELEKFKTSIQSDPAKKDEVTEVDGFLQELAEQKNLPEKIEVEKQPAPVTQANGDVASNKVVESSVVKRPAAAEEDDEGSAKRVKFEV